MALQWKMLIAVLAGKIFSCSGYCEEFCHSLVKTLTTGNAMYYYLVKSI